MSLRRAKNGMEGGWREADGVDEDLERGKVGGVGRGCAVSLGTVYPGSGRYA